MVRLQAKACTIKLAPGAGRKGYEELVYGIRFLLIGITSLVTPARSLSVSCKLGAPMLLDSTVG